MAERRTIASALGDASMTGGEGKSLDYRPVPVLPDVKVLKIGGQSVQDRGREALFPILEEIVAAKDRHDILVMCGGGTRARHMYAIAADLELPTGVLAAIGGYVPLQNARMVQMLLAKHGGIHVYQIEFGKLPAYFRMGCIPIMAGMPPFGLWEAPQKGSRVPIHRTDAGTYLTAEVLGAPRVIFVKDENGLFETDPKKDPTARHIPRISAAELEERDLPDVVVERCVVEYMQRARACREVQIINGLVPGQLTRALDGEDVGTIIHA